MDAYDSDDCNSDSDNEEKEKEKIEENFEFSEFVCNVEGNWRPEKLTMKPQEEEAKSEESEDSIKMKNKEEEEEQLDGEHLT